MRLRTLALGLIVGSLSSSIAPADDPPGRIVVSLPGTLDVSRLPVPKLPRELEERAQFNYFRMAFNKEEQEKLSVVPFAEAYLTDPRCVRFHENNSARAIDLIRGAVREQSRIAGTYVPPSFTETALEMAGLPPWAMRDPLPDRLGLKGPNLEVYEELRSKAIEPLIDRAPLLGQLSLLNGQLGSQMDKMRAVADGESYKHLTNAAMACRPESRSPILFGSAKPPNEALDGIRRILASADRDRGSVAARAGGDADRYGLGLVMEPLDKWAEGNRERQKLVELYRSGATSRTTLDEKVKARPDLRDPIEAMRAVGRSAGKPGFPPRAREKPGAEAARKSEEAAWHARVLTGTMDRAREVDWRLADQARAIRSRPSETAEDEKAKADKLEKITQERLAESQRYRRMAGLALNSLANLGLDPALVHDLSVVTDSGFQIADGIIMLSNASNPMGWLSILSGVTNLLGGFGPNPMQMILDQLHEIRRDLAEFRAEVRAQFAALRGDVLSSAQRVLTRIEDLEYNLSREIGEVKAQVRWNEYRLGQVEGQISALSHQILTRFAELHQKDLVTLLAARDLNPGEFRPLDSSDGRTELLTARYRDATAVTYASAVHHAASRTMSGGDFEVPAAYGVATPRVSAGGPSALLPLAQHPTAPWSNPNDFVDLARSAGFEPLPAPKPGATSDALNRSGLVPDRSRVVNPLAWSLAAGAYLSLAEESPEFFSADPGLRRGLAEIYLRGEEFNDMANRLASPPDGGVFAALIDSQLAAMDRLDRRIKDTTNGVAQRLGGVDPWKGIRAQAVPKDYPFVSWKGSSPEWQNGLKARGRIDGTNGTLFLGKDGQTVEPNELRALVDSGLVPRAFCLAGLIPPNVMMSGRRSILGGEIELKVTDIELPDEYVVIRGARREATGFLGTGPGKYHDVYIYDGPVRVTFEVRYRERNGTFDYPIVRKRLLTPKKFRFFHDDEAGYSPIGDDARFPFWTGDVKGLEAWRRLVPLMRNGSWSFKFSKSIDPAAFVMDKENWAGLKAGLVALKPDTQPDPAAGDLLPAEAVEAALEERLRAEAFEATDAAFRDLKTGLSEPGEAVREIVGCQWTLYRFIQLALPESARDPELRALVLGDQAAWGGSSVMSRFAPGNKLVVYNQATGEVGKPGYVASSATSPLVQSMRVQTSKLQAKIEELLARRRGQGPAESFRHPVVEAALLRILATAHRLNIDIAGELRGMGMDVPEHWAVRALPIWNDKARANLGEATR